MSIYEKAERTILPKRKHKLPLRIKNKSSDRFNHKFERCWYCGFIYDRNKISLGSEYSGISVTDYPYEETDIYYRNDSLLIMSLLDEAEDDCISLELGALNEPITNYPSMRKAESNQGCPHCGTTNL